MLHIGAVPTLHLLLDGEARLSLCGAVSEIHPGDRSLRKLRVDMLWSAPTDQLLGVVGVPLLERGRLRGRGVAMALGRDHVCPRGRQASRFGLLPVGFAIGA